MSKYTTEVRYICESNAGMTESQGRNKISEILAASAPNIFDFDFPIFDENYRLPLEIKILRHYYTREICEETVGLWKLRLEDRLNVIMPYYNQMYESQLLEFNPLYDFDLIRKHNRDNSEQGNDERITNSLNTQSGSKNGTQIIDTDTTNKSERNDNEVTNEDVSGIKQNTTSKTSTGNNEETVEESKNNRTQNESNSVLSGTKNETTVGHSNETNNETLTGSKSGESNSNNLTNTENVSKSNAATTESGTNSNTEWRLYSDTPQGGIAGIEGTIAGLEGNNYLTNATKTTQNGTTTGSTTANGNTNENGSATVIGNEETNERESKSTDGSSEKTNNVLNNGEHSENASETKEGVEIGSSNKAVNGEYTDTVTGSDNSRESETSNGSRFSSGEVADRGTVDTTITNTTTANENATARTFTEGNKSIMSTEEYIEHVKGKMSRTSYSKLLTEFRETFLNIDANIIEELSDLFFGLW